MAECANAFARSELRTQLIRLTDHLTAHDRLVFPTEAEWHRAKLAYAHERPGLPTLIDHLSFAVMHRLGLRQAFTNDGHFRDAGFEALF